MVLCTTVSVVEGSNEVKDLPTLLLHAAGAWKFFTNTVIVLVLSLFRRHIIMAINEQNQSAKYIMLPFPS